MEKNTNNWNRIKIGCLLTALLVVLLCILGTCSTAPAQDGASDLDSEEGMQTAAVVEYKTAYGVLQFPEEMAPHLRHMEVTEGHIAMEVFYLILEDRERELFRIYYSSAAMGTELGYLTVGDREVPVTYSVCEYEKDDFSGQANWELYCTMMDGFTTILNSFYNNPQFSATRTVQAVEDTVVTLTYWKLPLPDNMEYEEITGEDTYRVNFYGIVSGDRMLLYAIQLGEPALQSGLGSYSVDGMDMVLSLETNEMVLEKVLEEEEQQILYEMMDSINPILDIIMSDKNFAG